MSEEFNNENVVYEDLGRIMGLSAYELAVRNGYDGTEEEWLASLIGKTAFEVAAQNGFTGTQAEWLESLKSKVLNITKTTSGNVNTYTMTFNNGNTQTFTVDNGKEISAITKQSSTDTDSTLLITFNDDTTTTVTVPNGSGIVSVEKIDTEGLVDTYQINFTDKDPITFTVTNGNGIVSIAKTNTDGIYDTYTITYTNGTTSTFTLKNSIDTEPMDFTSDFTEGFNYNVGTSFIDRALPFAPIISDANPLIDSFTTAGSHPYRDSASLMRCVGVKVSAGQMFKITAHHFNSANTTLIFAEGHTSPIVKEIIQRPLDDFYYYIRKDGWIFVNSTIAYEKTSVKKVTIFDEVEENQRLLAAALASIPTVNAVRDAVLATLSIAEGSEF